jgi:hypothetical protein
MPTYITLSNFTHQGIVNVKHTSCRGNCPSLEASAATDELVTIAGSEDTIGAALALARVTVGSYLSRCADIEAARIELRQMFGDRSPPRRGAHTRRIACCAPDHRPGAIPSALGQLRQIGVEAQRIADALAREVRAA